MIVQCLKPGLALPGEAIVRQGERGSGLFFIMKGVVEVVHNGTRLRLLSAIAAVGESSLIDEAAPQSTVRAMSFCEVTVLTCVDFNAVTEHVPTLRYFLQMYATRRDKAAAARQAKQRSSSPTGMRNSVRSSITSMFSPREM